MLRGHVDGFVGEVWGAVEFLLVRLEGESMRGGDMGRGGKEEEEDEEERGRGKIHTSKRSACRGSLRWM